MPRKMIRLGPKLSVPAEEYATTVTAALGMRGSGKTNIISVGVEGLLEHGIAVIVLDYVGIHWSIRLGPDGKRKSKFDIPVIGGDHGDIGLEATAGRVVGEALAKAGSSAVVDISNFTKGNRARFLADFGEAFFHTKKKHRSPVQLVLEEAQRIVPQKILHGEPHLARMLGAFEEIAETGRNFGVGLALMSLRPEKVNKDVLNLAELLFAFRMTGFQERQRVQQWVKEKNITGREEVAGELPSIPRGEALVWSPGWLKLYGHHKLYKKATYDAGATPTGIIKSVKLKPLNLDELEVSMAEVVEQGKENDPKALKKRIAELERQVKKGATTKTVENRVEVPIPTVPPQLRRFVPKLRHLADELADVVKAAETAELKASRAERQIPSPPAEEKRPVNRKPPSGNGVNLGKGERAVLVAVAQHTAGVTNEQLSVLTGYKRSSRDAYVQRLRGAGYVTKEGTRIKATVGGAQALGDDFEPLPTGDALRTYWLNRLPEGERKVLEVLIEYHPDAVARETIDASTDYKRSSRDAYIQRLKARQLIVIPGPGEVRASDNLF